MLVISLLGLAGGAKPIIDGPTWAVLLHLQRTWSFERMFSCILDKGAMVVV